MTGVQTCALPIYQTTGYDPVMTLYLFAKENGLVDGRNPKRYFVGDKETGPYFDDRKILEYLDNDPDMVQALIRRTKPELNKMLSTVDSKDLERLDNNMIDELNEADVAEVATGVRNNEFINPDVIESFVKDILVGQFGYDYDTIMNE